jgi:hypothetical protein
VAKCFVGLYRCESESGLHASNDRRVVCPNAGENVMSRLKSLIESQYETLLFAKSSEAAREAAVELVRMVLGEDALARPLEDALRDCCRVLRPAKDPKEQLRFEEEFLELAIWPGKSHKIAA